MYVYIYIYIYTYTTYTIYLLVIERIIVFCRTSLEGSCSTCLSYIQFWDLRQWYISHASPKPSLSPYNFLIIINLFLIFFLLFFIKLKENMPSIVANHTIFLFCVIILWQLYLLKKEKIVDPVARPHDSWTYLHIFLLTFELEDKQKCNSDIYRT